MHTQREKKEPVLIFGQLFLCLGSTLQSQSSQCDQPGFHSPVCHYLNNQESLLRVVFPLLSTSFSSFFPFFCLTKTNRHSKISAMRFQIETEMRDKNKEEERNG